MQKFWSGVMAVALGAMAGILVSKEIATRLGLSSAAVLAGALVGAAFGGVSAWAGSDVPNFLAGVSRAWREVIAYRPSPKRGLALMIQGLLSFFVVWTLISFAIGVFMLMDGDGPLYLPSFVQGWERYRSYCVVTLVFTLVFAVGSFLIGFLFKKDEDSDRSMFKMLLVINPVTVPLAVMLGLTAIWFALDGICLILALNWLVTALAVGAVGLWYLRDFIARAYQYVHTYQRRCAFVGAVSGVLVASFTGYSVVLGAVVGALVFTAEYQFAMRVFPGLAPE